MWVRRTIFIYLIGGVFPLAVSCIKTKQETDRQPDAVVLPNPDEEDEEQLRVATVKADSNGAVIASVDGNSSEGQIISGSTDSGVSDVSVIFAGNSLRRNLDVKVEEGADLSSELENLGFGDAEGGTAIVVTGSDPDALTKKMVVKLPVPTVAGLNATESDLVIIYKVIVPGEGIRVGFLPTSDYKVEDGEITIYSQYFGSFQALYLAADPDQVEEVEVESNIVSSNGAEYTSSDGFHDSTVVIVADESCEDTDLSTVPVGVQVLRCDGSKAAGTLVVTTYQNCSSSGQQNCIVASSFVAASSSELTAANIRSGSTIAGVSGTLEVPDVDDVRIGVAVADTTGALKASCRNMTKLTLYNSATLPDNTALTDADGGDWWDTLDDFFASATVNFTGTATPDDEGAWSSNYACNGSQLQNSTATIGPVDNIPPGDYGGTTGSVEFHVTYYDSYSDLYMTNILDAATDSWSQAVSICDALNNSGSGGSALGIDWRVPTQKELLQLYVNGIYSLDGDLIGELNGIGIWTATTASDDPTAAWTVRVENGQTEKILKTDNTNAVLCVR